ncbi:hypothetical protein CTA1_5272 [Colletotrichum tanaceti]|uniref:Uncharacterized protein n=1 Tax=Colletotrichum tanaceti TaxID=1306861 RepID=A0A4U6XMU7_9PEZI|nr:hypothetical protein CTA1_5272 [Colletotrichum tanaceti]
MRGVSVALLLAAGILPVSAECGIFGNNFGACLNWCSDTNPGAEQYVRDWCYRAVCDSCTPGQTPGKRPRK